MIAAAVVFAWSFPVALLAVAPAPAAKASRGPARGTLIVDGGGATPAVVERFHQLAGGPVAKIVCFPTGASSLKFGAGGFGFGTILDPDAPRDRPPWTEYQRYLQTWFGVDAITLLHTRDPRSPAPPTSSPDRSAATHASWATSGPSAPAR